MENQSSFQSVLFKAIYENSENKLFKESFDPEHLEEGWKDNLKKGLATAAIAGGLMTGGMNSSQAQTYVDPSLPDGQQETGVSMAYANDDTSPIANEYQTNNIEDFMKKYEIKKTEDGYYTDKYGNKFNEEDIQILANGDDPFAEAVSKPHYEDNLKADMLYQDDLGAETENNPDWYQIWKNSQLKVDENEPFLNYIQRLKNSY